MLQPLNRPIPAEMAKTLASHLEEFEALMEQDSARLRRLQGSIPCYAILKQTRQLKQVNSPRLSHLLGLQQLSTTDYRHLLHWFKTFGPQTTAGQSAGM